MKWKLIAFAGAGVAALALAFLYFHLISSVIAGVSTLAPRQDAPATSSQSLPWAGYAIAPTPGDNRQETKNSGLPDQVAQAQMSPTPTTSTEAESRKKQLLELLDAARAEFANSGGTAFEIQGLNQDGGTDAVATFQQFEAQIKAAMQAIDANPPQIDQQASAVAPEKRDGRTRHRRRR
jgi:hypothetical protein